MHYCYFIYIYIYIYIYICVCILKATVHLHLFLLPHFFFIIIGHYEIRFIAKLCFFPLHFFYTQFLLLIRILLNQNAGLRVLQFYLYK